MTRRSRARAVKRLYELNPNRLLRFMLDEDEAWRREVYELTGIPDVYRGVLSFDKPPAGFLGPAPKQQKKAPE